MKKAVHLKHQKLAMTIPYHPIRSGPCLERAGWLAELNHCRLHKNTSTKRSPKSARRVRRQFYGETPMLDFLCQIQTERWRIVWYQASLRVPPESFHASGDTRSIVQSRHTQLQDRHRPSLPQDASRTLLF